MKPHWSDAPLWANWLARDEDGNWHWHQYKPSIDRLRWRSVGEMEICHYHESWRDSLEGHPDSEKSLP